MKIIGSLLSKMLGFLGLSPQLFVGYLLLAGLTGVGCVSGVLWWKNSHLEQQVVDQSNRIGSAETTIQNQQQAIADQSGTISSLQTLRKSDSDAIEALVNDFSTLAKNDHKVQGRLSRLEATNETVRKFMGTAVPSELGCVYDDSCPPETGASISPSDGGSKAAGPAVKTLPALSKNSH